MNLLKIFDVSLGRDFWNFRLGQLISLLGDSCGAIALAWWILDKTGSASDMSIVLAPAMVVKIFLLPLLGPLGDNFSRKHLVVIADFWRFIFSGILASMVFFDYFNLALLTWIYILISLGSALFNAAAGGIVPQIVSREKLQTATRQTQTINSFAGILGGILGGVIVTMSGVFGAFLIDSCSYLISAITALQIRANTKPERTNVDRSFIHWKNELVSGFKLLYKIPVLFWICIVAMLMNLALSPLGVILPVLAKEGRNLPPWFLGGLESSIGLGAIVGALTFAKIQKRIPSHLALLMSLAMIGIGVAMLPWVPNIFLPLTVLFWIGVGSSWSNIPIGTQISLTVPNAYRSRIGSIMGFLCNGISPLGIAAAGYLITALGLNKSLLIMGLGVSLLAPLILLIPKIKEFLSATPKEAEDFISKNYPNSFH